MRAVEYVRVSTTKQDADNQVAQLDRYCQQQSWDVVERYVDVITGDEESRPAWDRMFLDAHQAKYDIVIFWALDRFSRSGTLYTLQKLKELENCRVAWHSFQEPYFSSIGDFKDVVVSIMATLAKIEKRRISERTKAGLAKAINVGKRGRDKKRRKGRSDRGKPRGVIKSPQSFINKQPD